MRNVDQADGHDADWRRVRFRSAVRLFPRLAVAALVLAAPRSAAAQMLGITMQQLAGPFAARPAPGSRPLMMPFSGQAGANSLMMPGTQALLPAMNNVVGAMNRPGMALSSQLAAQAPQGSGSMPPMDQGQGTPQSEKGSGGDAPDAGDITDNFVELLIGACAGGAFIGGFSAANAAAPAAATGVAAPAAASAVLSAMGAGCILGVATASVSLGAVSAWRSLGR